jgi:hypothetical protein
MFFEVMNTVTYLLLLNDAVSTAGYNTVTYLRVCDYRRGMDW